MQDIGEGPRSDMTTPAPVRPVAPQPLPTFPPLFTPSSEGPPAAGALPVPELATGDFTVSADPRTGRDKRTLAVMVAAVAMVTAVAGGVVAFTGGSPGPPAMQSPIDANAQLYAAANASGSFHYVSVSSAVVNGRTLTETQTGDVGRGEGTQSLTGNAGNYQVIVLNSTAYLRADLAALENAFGYTPSEAAPIVNKWIAFTPADSPYSSIAAGVTSESVWGNPSDSPGDQLPQTPVSVSQPSALGGRSVQTVSYHMHGTKASTGASYTGTEHIAFATSTPHLPYSISEVLSGSANGQSASGTDRITFSRWGEPVGVSAPVSSVPFASLPGPTTTA